MISKRKHKKVTWIDMESPTSDEVRQVIDEYGVHPLIGEELLHESVRSKVDLYDNFIYLILHFPTIGHSHNGENSHEIDFVISKDLLITVHYEQHDTIHEFEKIFEVNSILDKSNMGEHGGYLFYYMIKELYKNLGHELDDMSRTINLVEERIFAGEERLMVQKISEVNRKLLNFKQNIRLHKDVLESFEVAGVKFFTDKFIYYLRSITGEYYKVSSMLEGHRETMLELRETNESLLANKTNETMKTLTIMATMMLPATLVSQLFGISSLNVPFMDSPYSFFIVAFMVIIIGTFMYSLFKLKKWL